MILYAALRHEAKPAVTLWPVIRFERGMMRHGFVARWQSNFRFRLVLATSAAIALIVSLFAMGQFLLHARSAEQAQQRQADHLAELMAESLAQPLFEFNTSAVTLAANALAAQADVRWVLVRDSKGELVAAAGLSAANSDRVLMRQRPILFHNGVRRMNVGSIELALSRGSLEAELKSGAIESALSGLLVGLGAVLAALWAFRAITRPLTQISEGLDQLASGQTNIVLPPQSEDEFGRMSRALLRFRDEILERQKVECSLRENQERFRDFSQSSTDWFWEMDEQLRFSYFSENFAVALGVNPSFLLGKERIDVEDFAVLNQPSVRLELLGRLARREAFRDVQYQIRKPDGGVLWIGVSGVPHFDSEGHFQGYRGVGQDLTAKRLAEQELENYREHLEQMVTERTAQLAEAKEAAEAASRAKGSFVANMSHEIRTPLNAVLGLARIIMRENEGRKSGRTAGQILEAGEHLLGVVNDVLDFSRIESGKLRIEMRAFRLMICVDEAIKLVSERAYSKHLLMQLEHEPGMPLWVEGDRLRIEQILINLLSNAIKFTERGRIVVALSCHGGQTHFKISDSGIGLSGEQMQRLFQPFEQADASTTRKYGGTGLGLVISRNLARQMGGDLVVESELGRGSVFTLSLPLQAVSPEAVAAWVSGGAARLVGLRILAVEDMELNRIVLGDMLENEGAQVVFAEDGRQALDLLVAPGGGHFDLLLTDIQMPVMDGYELAQRVRALHIGLPVIGLSAHVMPEAFEQSLGAGMSAHISKPIDCNALVASILQFVKRPAADQVLAPPALAVDLTASEMIDWAALSERYRGRTEFSEKLFVIFLRTHSASPQKLRNAARAYDVETIKSLAHALQGIAGNIEASSLRELAIQTEQCIHEGREDSLSLAETLATHLADLLAMLAGRVGQGVGPE